MKTVVISAVLTISFLLSGSPLVSSQTEYSYEPGATNGPEHWGELNVNWTKCGTGHLQSPIDLLNERVQVNPYLEGLVQSYRPVNATLINRGHDIEMNWNQDAGSIEIQGNTYNFLQFHWHSPSEHTINGRRYEMEMHMVHKTADGNNIAVIGFLYKYGHPDPILAELEPYIKQIASVKDKQVPFGIFDPSKLKIGCGIYYRYLGSLTTPPCTEGVIWTISQKILTVSKDQVQMLKDAVEYDSHDNARPIQSIYDRMISMYLPRKINN